MNTGKTILIIDDQVHIRRVIQLKLEKSGYNVLSAGDGREGLELMTRQKPDAVVSDIMMPLLDGRTLCEMTDPLKRERPFLTIMLTARISPEDREWVQRMRETVFMEKPFSPSKLVSVLDEYFGVVR